jgi:hypothetical protein
VERGNDPQGPCAIIAVMNPKLVGNPLVAWREDTVLQIGWGLHAVSLEDAPAAFPGWLRTIDGRSSRRCLIEAAGRAGIPRALAASTLDRLKSAGLVELEDPRVTVRIHPCGLLEEPLATALEAAGATIDPEAEIVVFPQGQLPTLLGAPDPVRRLVPVWFEARAVHVGPVLDNTRGPCSRCIDRTWSQMDPAWTTLVAQATTVPTWSNSAQLVQAAGAIVLIADDPTTVGLEMIYDPMKPGPMWRVWSVNDQCDCRLPQVRELPHRGGSALSQQTTTGPSRTGTRR